MKIAVFLGSIRQGRTGLTVATWALGQLRARNDGHTYEMADLLDQDLPDLVDVPPSQVKDGQYADPATTAWGELMGGFNAYIFVTPEYNASIPGTMKNAFDLLFYEWEGKPVGIISYGGNAGRTSRAHWHDIVVRAQMVPIEAGAAFSFREHFPGREFIPGEQGEAWLHAMADELTAQ